MELRKKEEVCSFWSGIGNRPFGLVGVGNWVVAANVADSSTERRLHGGRGVAETGKPGIGGLLLRKRIVMNRVDRDFGELDVLRDILKVRAVKLPHQKELLGVAHDDRSDPRGFELAVLLDNGERPAVELAKLGVAFRHDLFATGHVQEAGYLLEDDSLPQRSR